MGKTTISKRKKGLDPEQAKLAGTIPPPRRLDAGTEARIRQEFQAYPHLSHRVICRKLKDAGVQVGKTAIYMRKVAFDVEQAKRAGTVPPPPGGSLDARTEARIQQEFHAHPTDTPFAIWRKLKDEGVKVSTSAIYVRKAAFDAAQDIPAPNLAPSSSQQGPSSSQPAPASVAVGGAGAPHPNIAWAANYIRQPGNWGQH
ncbi:hypothetical protein, partial [Brucella intermedia]|uniref:hypothetical protein n=1 Tax=Brucella intermedia TaxID=94625 RepID=UPI0023602FC5